MVSCNASWVRAPAQCKPRKGKNQPSYSYVHAYATARRIPPLVIASTYGSVGVRALLASCLTDAVRRRAASLPFVLSDAKRSRDPASLTGRIRTGRTDWGPGRYSSRPERVLAHLWVSVS